MPSFSYHLLRAVLKLKGVKKIFSQDPMPYEQLRKEDLASPPKRLLRGCKSTTFTLLDSQVTVLKEQQQQHPERLLLFFPGGAFVSGPNLTAWSSALHLTKATGCTTWVVNYPKAPEFKLMDVATNMDALYQHALEQYSPENIYLMGDSAGGHVALTLVLRLLENKLPLPKHAFIICPVVELTLSNPAIAAIDPLDVMLSVKGARSAHRLALGDWDSQHPQASPLYGNFEGSSPMTFFLAEQDVLYPDAVLLVERLREAGVEVEAVFGEKMMHVWPFLPFLKEGGEALKKIEAAIN